MLPLVSVFEQLGGEFEEVVFLHDPPTGLRAIVAVHSTVLGPALGGTRCYPFASDDDALADVLRLSRAMTYKAAAAGLDLGGGKAVIIGDPRTVKTGGAAARRTAASSKTSAAGTSPRRTWEPRSPTWT